MNGEVSAADGPQTPLLDNHDREPANAVDSSSYESGRNSPDAPSSASSTEGHNGDHLTLAHTIDFPDDDTLPEMAAPDGGAADADADTAAWRGKLYKRMLSNPRDELRQFSTGLRWLGLDQSTPLKVAWSWVVFFLYTFIVPAVNFTSVSCPDCDESHKHPFERLVQMSESALAAVSFFFLSQLVRTFGLRRTLLLDKIVRESDEVRKGYEDELDSAFSLLGWILLPSFSIELVFRVWWYVYVSISIPFIHNDPRLNVVLCSAGMLSWLYRAAVFLFTCILFRLMCCLQILRLRGYNQLLQSTPDVSVILSEHMRIRSQLHTISHRFRLFLVASLIVISFSQTSSLFVLLSSADKFNFFRAGDLVVCSMVQLTGLVICLHGAARITHRAQRIVGIVSQWQALATCNPDAVSHDEGGADPLQRHRALYGPAHPVLYNDNSDSSSEDLESESPPRSSIHAAFQQSVHDIEAFQKRQALVTYLQHSRAGVSLYGFVLDRGFLYGMFGVVFSITLFILGKTIIT